MKKNVLWRFLLIGATVLVAVIFFLPNTPLFKFMPDWWKKSMPSKGIVLGLDLQGGLHLVFEVEGDKAVEASTERFTYLIKETLQKKKLQAEVKRNGLQIEITPSSPGDIYGCQGKLSQFQYCRPQGRTLSLPWLIKKRPP